MTFTPLRSWPHRAPRGRTGFLRQLHRGRWSAHAAASSCNRLRWKTNSANGPGFQGFVQTGSTAKQPPCQRTIGRRFQNQLYSIPEGCGRQQGLDRLVAPDADGHSRTSQEVPMHKNHASVKAWLGRNSLPLVIVFSLLHVLVAACEVRDSGRADCG